MTFKIEGAILERLRASVPRGAMTKVDAILERLKWAPQDMAERYETFACVAFAQ
jgi:hypothetical protein